MDQQPAPRTPEQHSDPEGPGAAPQGQEPADRQRPAPADSSSQDSGAAPFGTGADPRPASDETPAQIAQRQRRRALRRDEQDSGEAHPVTARMRTVSERLNHLRPHEDGERTPNAAARAYTTFRTWEHSPAEPVMESIDSAGADPEDHGPPPPAPPADSAHLNLEHYTSPAMQRARAIARSIFFSGLVDRTVRRRVVRKPGAERLKGACVIVANHSSHLDAPLIMTSLPVNLRASVATAAAADYFFTSWYKRIFTQMLFNTFPVDRKGTGENRGLSRKLLQAGVPILIFPEGTRSKDGKMREFKLGAANLASSLKAPVLPVAMIGAHEAMPRGTSWPRRGRPPVVVAIGEPMRAREKETTVAFNDRIQATVRSLYREYRYMIED